MIEIAIFTQFRRISITRIIVKISKKTEFIDCQFRMLYNEEQMQTYSCSTLKRRDTFE